MSSQVIFRPLIYTSIAVCEHLEWGVRWILTCKTIAPHAPHFMQDFHKHTTHWINTTQRFLLWHSSNILIIHYRNLFRSPPFHQMKKGKISWFKLRLNYETKTEHRPTRPNKHRPRLRTYIHVFQCLKFVSASDRIVEYIFVYQPSFKKLWIFEMLVSIVFLASRITLSNWTFTGQPRQIEFIPSVSTSSSFMFKMDARPRRTVFHLPSRFGGRKRIQPCSNPKVFRHRYDNITSSAKITSKIRSVDLRAWTCRATEKNVVGKYKTRSVLSTGRLSIVHGTIKLADQPVFLHQYCFSKRKITTYGRPAKHWSRTVVQLALTKKRTQKTLLHKILQETCLRLL